MPRQKSSAPSAVAEMVDLVLLTEQLHRDFPASAEKRRYKCLCALKEMLENAPSVETVLFKFIGMLLALPVEDRLYVQQAMRPLAKKLECTAYLIKLSRALQETDAWIDLNILSDKERRGLPDLGFVLNPEFKLP